MARGDGGKPVFEDDKERHGWLDLMERACGSFGWWVHAWVLMGKHFHLLLETPQPNLVSGMKWLLSTYSQGWPHLLRMLEKVPGRKVGASRRVGGAEKDHGEKEALRIVKEGSRMLGLPLQQAELANLRKSDVRKVQLAILLRTHTTVSNGWIAQKLTMGHPGSVSRSVTDGRADTKLTKIVKEIENVLIRVL